MAEDHPLVANWVVQFSVYRIYIKNMTARLNSSSFLTCDYIDKSQCDIGICGMEIFHFAIFDYY